LNGGRDLGGIRLRDNHDSVCDSETIFLIDALGPVKGSVESDAQRIDSVMKPIASVLDPKPRKFDAVGVPEEKSMVWVGVAEAIHVGIVEFVFREPPIAFQLAGGNHGQAVHVAIAGPVL
jgi:hypothetical protein